MSPLWPYSPGAGEPYREEMWLVFVFPLFCFCLFCFSALFSPLGIECLLGFVQKGTQHKTCWLPVSFVKTDYKHTLTKLKYGCIKQSNDGTVCT